MRWLLLGLLTSVAAGVAAVGGNPPVERAGLLGLPTELVPERDTAAQGLALAQRDYHRAQIDYSSHVRWRRLGAVQRQLEAEGYVCKPARVVEVRMVPGGEQRVLVSCGAKDGIRPGAVAVAFRGLVGLVNRVSQSTCEVVLLTDPLSGVPVAAYPPGTGPGAASKPERSTPGDAARERDERDEEEPATESETRPTGPQPARGAVRGDPKQAPGTLVLTYLDDAVVPDAEVYTSGEGTIYPAGLRVGQVIGHPTAGERGQPAYALVSAYVDWPSVREVVLAERRGGGEAR